MISCAERCQVRRCVSSLPQTHSFWRSLCPIAKYTLLELVRRELPVIGSQSTFVATRLEGCDGASPNPILLFVPDMRPLGHFHCPLSTGKMSLSSQARSHPTLSLLLLAVSSTLEKSRIIQLLHILIISSHVLYARTYFFLYLFPRDWSNSLRFLQIPGSQFKSQASMSQVRHVP